VLRREHGHHAGLLIDGIQHTVGAWNVDDAQSLLRALLFRAVTDLLHRPTRSRASSPAPTGQRWNVRCASRKTDVALPHDLRIDERARSGRRRHGQRGRRKPKKSSHDDCVTDDRQRLARTFDSASELYQQGRPEYPEPLYDTLVEVAGIGAGDRLLEVGCATGKATLPLARRGFRITCVEIGPDLVAVARRNLAAFPNVEVMGGVLETWQPPLGDRFDLVFAATAWHWIDPELRTSEPGSLCAPEVTSPSGVPPTSYPKTVTRSSSRSRTSTRRSAKECPRTRPCCGPAASPTVAPR